MTQIGMIEMKYKMLVLIKTKAYGQHEIYKNTFK